MYFTVYKVINKINNKYYIGKHKTKKPEDFYMGSGKQIKDAIRKYGIENFDKQVLFVFDSEVEMNEKERELVTKQICEDKNSYNMHEGGNGGFHHIHISEKRKEYLSLGGKMSPFGRKEWTQKQENNKFKSGDKRTLELSKKANAHRIKHGLSEEHKRKISEAMKKVYQS